MPRVQIGGVSPYCVVQMREQLRCHFPFVRFGVFCVMQFPVMRPTNLWLLPNQIFAGQHFHDALISRLRSWYHGEVQIVGEGTIIYAFRYDASIGHTAHMRGEYEPSRSLSVAEG